MPGDSFAWYVRKDEDSLRVQAAVQGRRRSIAIEVHKFKTGKPAFLVTYRYAII